MRTEKLFENEKNKCIFTWQRISTKTFPNRKLVITRQYNQRNLWKKAKITTTWYWSCLNRLKQKRKLGNFFLNEYNSIITQTFLLKYFFQIVIKSVPIKILPKKQKRNKKLDFKTFRFYCQIACSMFIQNKSVFRMVHFSIWSFFYTKQFFIQKNMTK